MISSSLEIVQGMRAEGEPNDGLLKVLNDYMTAIRRRHLKNQAKQIANQLRNEIGSETHPEKLERIMNLVRDRHSLDREK
jgi:DNA polymerase III delta subunit